MSMPRREHRGWWQDKSPDLPDDEHTGATGARALLDKPPDGVDLSALDPDTEHKLASPQECLQMYEQAFEAAGGCDALDAMEPLARHLETEMAGVNGGDVCGWGRSWQPHQMGALQSYDLSFMARCLGEEEAEGDQGVGAKSATRAQGEQVLHQLGADIQARVSADCRLVVAGVKKKDRAMVKINIKYGSDCSQLCDMNRATLVCPDIRSMYTVASYLFKRFGPRVCLQGARLVEWEDHYQTPMHGGYRHLQAVLLIGASLWEVQINTAPMNKAKKQAGHKLYKTTRFVREMILFATMQGDHKVLRELLEKPGVHPIADPNAVRDKNGMSALHHAALRGDKEVIKLLLSPSHVARLADVWATDGALHGGLALNYAMVMCHYGVAQALVGAMTATVPPGGVGARTKSRLAEAVAAMVDRFEYVKEAGEPDAEASETLLRSLAQLWSQVQASSTDDWSGMDPLKYAFTRGATVEEADKLGRGGSVPIGARWSVPILLEFADLWIVDNGGMLPMERAATMGLEATAHKLSEKMMQSRPPLHQLPRAAIWSLARCRTKARFPAELVHEVIIVDAMLKQREEEEAREAQMRLAARQREKEEALRRMSSEVLQRSPPGTADGRAQRASLGRAPAGAPAVQPPSQRGNSEPTRQRPEPQGPRTTATSSVGGKRNLAADSPGTSAAAWSRSTTPAQEAGPAVAGQLSSAAEHWTEWASLSQEQPSESSSRRTERRSPGHRREQPSRSSHASARAGLRPEAHSRGGTRTPSAPTRVASPAHSARGAARPAVAAGPESPKLPALVDAKDKAASLPLGFGAAGSRQPTGHSLSRQPEEEPQPQPQGGLMLHPHFSSRSSRGTAGCFSARF